MVLYGGQYYIQSTVRILKMLRQSPIIQAAEQVISPPNILMDEKTGHCRIVGAIILQVAFHTLSNRQQMSGGRERLETTRQRHEQSQSQSVAETAAGTRNGW